MIFGNDPDRDWERYGAEDPYYAILNTEAYRRSRLDEAAMEEIFRSGENTVDTFLGQAERRFGPLARDRALEYGCGVGRLLIPLAREFDSVCGVDISPSMLGEAARQCHQRGAADVELALADDRLSRVEGTFDFAISFLVLQHIPVGRGERIVGGILQRLRPGGVAALHFTTHRSSPRWRHAVHVLRRNFLTLHCIANLVSGLRLDEPLMQTNLYRLERITDLARARGIDALETLPIQYGDLVGVMAFLRRAR